jgi:hypothetical protein
VVVVCDFYPGAVGRGVFLSQEPQVLQLPELQLEQELPVPATRVGTPLSVVLKQAKVDILRRAGLWQ